MIAIPPKERIGMMHGADIDAVLSRTEPSADELMTSYIQRLIRRVISGRETTATIKPLLTLENLLRSTLVASHLAGRYRVRGQLVAHIAARRGLREKALAMNPVHADAVKFMQSRAGLSDDEIAKLEAIYGDEAIRMTTMFSQDVNQAVDATLAEAVQDQLSAQATLKKVQATLATAGASAKKSKLMNLIRTNTQLAYGAGRWNSYQDPDIADLIWGFEYVTVGDDRVRPNHKAMDGIRLPKEDPFWKNQWPPNGYQCRCSTLEILKDDDLATPNLIANEQVDAKPVADEGWKFNPGDLYADILNPSKLQSPGKQKPVIAPKLVKPKPKVKKRKVELPPPVDPGQATRPIGTPYPDFLTPKPKPPKKPKKPKEPTPLPADPGQATRPIGTPNPFLREETPKPKPEPRAKFKPMPALEPPKPALPDIKSKQSDFPDDVGSLKVVKKLGGSTGAELVEDSQGRQWVRKYGNHADHLRDEFEAEEIYRAMGVSVPDSRMYVVNNQPMKLSRFIPDAKPLGSLTGAERERALEQIRKGFSADAIVGNWDVIGAGADNILIDKEGKAWRIDVGGSLRYRAQGGPKNEDWNDFPTEFWTMRGKGPRPASSAVAFKDMKLRDISDQVKDLHAKKKRILDSISDLAIRDRIEKRLDNAHDILGIDVPAYLDDNMREEWADLMTEHQMGIKKANVFEKMSREFKETGRGRLIDENGEEFDSLRGGGDSVVPAKFEAYIKANGGDLRIINKWAGEQAGSSWKESPQAIKKLLAQQMNLDEKEIYWGDGSITQDVAFNNVVARHGKEKFEKTVAMQQAHMVEFLKKFNAPNTDHVNRTIRIVRTESARPMSGLNVGDSFIRGGTKDAQAIKDADPTIKKVTKGAVYESTSHFSVITVSNRSGKVTEYPEVPFHRCLGHYAMGKGHSGSYYGTFFLNDSENEITAILPGMKGKVITTHQWHAGKKKASKQK